MPVLLSSAAQIFDRLAAIFDADYAKAAVAGATLHVGDCQVALRTTSRALRQQILRPLACPVEGAKQSTDFSIDLVDLGEAPLPELPWLPQHTSPEQETSEYMDGPFLITRHGDVLLTVFNQDTGRTVGLVHAPTRWPLRHYKQSIFITLYQQLRRRGFYLIHASAIALDGRAVLITGQSGVGKTTTMLTCVSAGFQFLGDDTTLVRRAPDGGVEVVALLSTLDVTDKTAAWFPELAPVISARRSHTGKRQIILSEAYPGRVAVQGRVAAILAPEIAGQEHTNLAPGHRISLLSDLLFFSIDLQDPVLAQRHLEFLAQAVEQIPVYRVLLGSDRRQVPQVIGALLRAAPAMGAPVS